MDYKEIYLKMMRASEEAVKTIIQAQRECEEMYINLCETEVQNTDKTTEICK